MYTKSFPFTFLFLFLMFIGTMISLSSNHWLGVWIGLELNLMSFLPIMLGSGSLFESESAIKYFIIQALASSAILMMSMATFYTSSSWDILLTQSEISSIIFMILLLIKLGGVPFHFWLPNIAPSLSWSSCFLLLTWQKIAPMLLIVYMNNSPNHLLLLGAISALVGSLGGINQTSLRILLTYSSISHTGWMICALLLDTSVFAIYLMTYLFLSSSIFLIISQDNTSSFTQLNKKKVTNTSSIVLLTSLLSLGGLPPLMGFFPKLLVVLLMMQTNMYPCILLLFTGSLISLYYYLNLSTLSMLSSSIQEVTHKSMKQLLVFSLSVVVNLLGSLLGIAILTFVV
uniref:NADH-ubiquinone oxidoreductase chain 2 n=1 Tax=Nautilus pompilius TaxID=34573 RepID=A0A221ZRW2_9MOLL|nr:NADH dehydrogenase subunit 2 [Nautilus pompilius]ASO66664.1 NADH dehydrogenase subunit 2 [Nautilus pompilius]